MARASSRRSSWSSATSTGSSAAVSSSVSIRLSRSPPPSPPTCSSSSSATTLASDSWLKTPCSSSRGICISAAISASEGLRRSDASSVAEARSTARAFCRTERGIQSIARSSSIMAPRIRVMA